MSMLAENVVNSIRKVIQTKEDIFVPLHEPSFKGNELKYVQEAIESTFVSSVGKFVDKFEIDLANYTGVKRAVAVVNGTAALHIALKLVGVTKNDEVLLPSLTFIATANAIEYCGATPHFIDVEERTLGVDPFKLERYLEEMSLIKDRQCFNKSTGRRIKAIIPMHTFGHPVDMDPLIKICNEYYIEVVEDAAESLGSLYKGKHTGSLGRVSAISFNGNKIMTTGGGGAILTNDIELADRAKHITTTSKIPHRWEYKHDEVGFNYRMPNLNAALGCAQLEGLPIFLENKRNLATKYKNSFKNMKDVYFKEENDFSEANYWLNCIVINNASKEERNNILELTNNKNIMTRPIWNLISELEMYNNYPKMDLSCSRNLQNRIINIPSSASLGGV